MALTPEAEAWLGRLRGAKKTSMVDAGRKKIHLTFADGVELVEEFDVATSRIQVRKWRRPGTLGGRGGWTHEIGEAPRLPTAAAAQDMLLTASSSNPAFVRCDTKKAFQWRIRNLPYPLDTYSMSVDDDGNAVLRTSNKKYFKRFPLEDLGRIGLGGKEHVDAGHFRLAHANNTLIIEYPKPAALVAFDAAVMAEWSAMKTAAEGDVDCSQS